METLVQILRILIPENPTWHHVVMTFMFCATLCYLANRGLLRTLAVAAHHKELRSFAATATEEQLAAVTPGGKVPGPSIGPGFMVLLFLGAGFLGGSSAVLLTRFPKPIELVCKDSNECPQGQTCEKGTCSKAARGIATVKPHTDATPADNRAPGFPVGVQYVSGDRRF
jgi:hypothetical protein